MGDKGRGKVASSPFAQQVDLAVLLRRSLPPRVRIRGITGHKYEKKGSI